jgi:hypothetical protein
MRRVALVALVVGLASPAAAQAHQVRVTAPAQFDVALAQVRYAVPHGPRPALHVALAGSAGLDYVAVALPRHQPRHALIALVAVVNRRPTGSQAPDLARILLGTRLSRAMRAPAVTDSVNVLKAGPPAKMAPACALGALGVGDLRFAMRAGAPPPGFGARATIAQALAAACGRPVDPAFRSAVSPPVTLPPQPVPPRPCPPCPPPPRYPRSPPQIICPDVTPQIVCPQPA